MSENVENLDVDNKFNELFIKRNSLLNLVSKEELLKSLEVTHDKSIAVIDFLRNKIKVSKDVLKYKDDIVVSEELQNYEYCLFVLRFNDSLIEEQILFCKKELKK